MIISSAGSSQSACPAHHDVDLVAGHANHRNRQHLACLPWHVSPRCARVSMPRIERVPVDGQSQAHRIDVRLNTASVGAVIFTLYAKASDL